VMIRTDGYKDTEIGAIPVDWELTFLEKVSDRLKAGGTPKTNVPDYWNGDSISESGRCRQHS